MTHKLNSYVIQMSTPYHTVSSPFFFLLRFPVNFEKFTEAARDDI